MADARDFYVEMNGAPLTGGAAGMTAIARSITGAVRTAPTIVELGAGVYRVAPTDADEAAGTVVLVDTGAGNEPRRVAIACFKGDNSNQFWSVVVENTDATAWAGAAPTVGLYSSSAGARTAPTLVAVEAAYLFVAVPTAADVTADTAIEVIGPAGSAQPYWASSTLPLVSTALPITPITISGVAPEATAAAALRTYLLQKLPAAVAALNLTRAATLRAPQPGPYTIPAAAVLKVSVTDKAGLTTSCALTSGSRTATQVAADINIAVPGLASVDPFDRLLLASSTAPLWTATTQEATDSVMAVGTDATGANIALGWDLTGEFVLITALVPPGLAGVCDGLPLGSWFDPSQLGKGRMLVTIGERPSKPKALNPRNYEWDVTLDVVVCRAEPQQVYQTREGIQAALQAVREIMVTDAGKQLGRARYGDITFAYEADCKVSSQSLVFTRTNQDGTRTQSPFFDAVNLKYLVRVYQAPIP